MPKFLKKYFRVTKDCGYENASDCLAESYKALDGGVGEIIYGPYHDLYYCVVINTGATICLIPYCDDYAADIIVDVNGRNKPNVLGRDAFHFAMNYRGDLGEVFGHSNNSRAELCDVNIDSIKYGAGCFDKIVSDGWVMDY